MITIIAALGRNRVIGKGNKLPWKLPADLKHFHKLTLHKPVIMGQKTFESLGKPLPGRVNIVISDDENFRSQGCIVAHSIEEAISAAKGHKEIMIAGGGSIYTQFLPFADKMYLTIIDGDFDGDILFPEYDKSEWIEKERIENKPDKNNVHGYTFLTLVRK